MRSAIEDAKAEAKGLRARIAEARRSAISLVQQDDDGEYVPTRGAALTSREHRLVAIEQRLVQLEDHLAYLRKFGRRLDRVIDRTTGS